MVSVALYTTQQILGLGLQVVFGQADDLTLKSISNTPSDLIIAILQTGAELAVLDLTPELTLSDVAEIRRKAPGCKVVLWVESVSLEVAHELKGLGVSGILRKDLSLELTMRCLRKVAEGELWFDRDLLASLLQFRSVRLSPRERQLLDFVSTGFSNKRIAGSLGISEGTVKIYFSKLFRKVGVSDRFELALLALKNHSADQRFRSCGAHSAVIVTTARASGGAPHDARRRHASW